MFNAQIKLDLKELTERVDLMERQLRRLYKEVAISKSQQKISAKPGLRHREHHDERYLVYKPDGSIDIDASLEAIGRTIHEVMSGNWASRSAENRIDVSLRARRGGRGGLLSREEWLKANPEQLDLFR
jgi:hypothetical protein